jgi:hypothetical protein
LIVQHDSIRLEETSDNKNFEIKFLDFLHNELSVRLASALL